MTAVTASALYVGQVMHRRLRPRRHRLRYRVFSLLLDLDEIDRFDTKLWLFSRNRFNLFSFRDRDYGDGSGRPLRDQIGQHIQQAGIPGQVGTIRLLTMPRMLGFAFNPLSVYFCDGSDGQPVAIVYEVHNTFGERHNYVLPVNHDPGPVIRQDCDKRFHVSPFMAMDMRYAFRVTPPGERVSVTITGSDGGGALITAMLVGDRRPLTDRTLTLAFVTHPLLTVKVVGGILWEAARLWAKGLRIHPHPTLPERPLTTKKPGIAR